MTIARRPSPFGELLSLRQAMDRLFEDSFVQPRAWGFGSGDGIGLPVDVSMSADELLVRAQLPGVKPDDVDITVDNGRLTIQAESATDDEKSEGDYLVREIRRGAFSRSIALPNGLEPDKGSATFENGVLTLRIPKAESTKPRQIRISTATNGKSSSVPVAASSGTSPSSAEKAG